MVPRWIDHPGEEPVERLLQMTLARHANEGGRATNLQRPDLRRELAAKVVAPFAKVLANLSASFLDGGDLSGGPITRDPLDDARGILNLLSTVGCEMHWD